jgi:hypothetical protein
VEKGGHPEWEKALIFISHPNDIEFKLVSHVF